MRRDTPATTNDGWQRVAPYFTPPPEYAGKLGDFHSPLLFDDGTAVKTPADWQRRRTEILNDWHKIMGPWPAAILKPRIEYLESHRRENFTQHHVRVEIAPDQTAEGYLLVPDGEGPFPAIFVPFYDPETSAGLKNKPTHAFAYDLARRGFVTLSIGSPGGSAWKPELKTGDKSDPAAPVLQPLVLPRLRRVQCYNTLASLPQVDAERVGVVGHSYGGKWRSSPVVLMTATPPQPGPIRGSSGTIPGRT